MTEDEFKEKLTALVAEFNKDEKYEVFIAMIDFDGHDIITLGYGCPACCAQAVADLFEAGGFQHTGTPNKTNRIH